MKQVLATGVIRAPHGVKGYVRVKPYSDDTEHFFSLKEVTLSKMGKEKVVAIENVQCYGSELLIKFSGYDNPEDARFISGWDILVPRDRACRLKKGEVYTADLIGMRLIYDNEEIAEIVSVFDGPQALLLEAETKDGKLHLIPFMRDIYVSDVDVEKGTMVLLMRELLQ